MKLQYLTDNLGNNTGVFIPIKDWEHLKNKYSEIAKEENDFFEVPQWHKDLILERLKGYNENPEDVLDWEKVKDDFDFE